MNSGYMAMNGRLCVEELLKTAKGEFLEARPSTFTGAVGPPASTKQGRASACRITSLMNQNPSA